MPVSWPPFSTRTYIPRLLHSPNCFTVSTFCTYPNLGSRGCFDAQRHPCYRAPVTWCMLHRVFPKKHWNNVMCSKGAHIWWVIIEIWQETNEREQKLLFPRKDGYFCHVTTQFPGLLIMWNSRYRLFIWGLITAWPFIRSRAGPHWWVCILCSI